MHDHEHNHGHSDSVSGSLIFAISLLSITLVIEVAGGVISRSLALLADAGHLFMDLFAMSISLTASILARRPPTHRRTFGWHRAEVLAAILNGILLIALSAGLVHEAIRRFQHPTEVLALPMLMVAVIGLITNLVIAFKLHGAHGRDLNVRGAYLHVLGDTGASLGVIVAATIIKFTGWEFVDPAVSLLIAAIILIGAFRLIFNASHILLEGVPGHISVKAVADTLKELENVNGVHDIHIWSVCSHILSLSCHVTADWQSPQDHDALVAKVTDTLWHEFGIMHATIQTDYEHCGDKLVAEDMQHPSP